MKLTEDIIRDWWLKKFHNTTSEEVVKKYPEQCKTPSWFKLYPVTQQQHDEWHEWMLGALQKEWRCSKKYIRKYSWAIYLQLAPNVKEDDMADGNNKT
jgi:hypothetical protein